MTAGIGTAPFTDREDQIVAEAVARATRPLRKVIWCMTAVALIVIVGAGAGWTIVRQESVNRTNEIQQSRIDVLVQSCMDTNSRNLGTLAKLDELAAQDPHPTPAERAGTQSAKLLIAALVPFNRDCHAYAHDRLDR